MLPKRLYCLETAFELRQIAKEEHQRLKWTDYERATPSTPRKRERRILIRAAACPVL